MTATEVLNELFLNSFITEKVFKKYRMKVTCSGDVEEVLKESVKVISEILRTKIVTNELRKEGTEIIELYEDLYESTRDTPEEIPTFEFRNFEFLESEIV